MTTKYVKCSEHVCTYPGASDYCPECGTRGDAKSASLHYPLGIDHARACADIRRQDREHRAYLNNTPGAWEHVAGR